MRLTNTVLTSDPLTSKRRYDCRAKTNLDRSGTSLRHARSLPIPQMVRRTAHGCKWRAATRKPLKTGGKATRRHDL